MSNHVGTCRFEENGKVFIRVWGFFKHGPDYITGEFCNARKYQAESSMEAEDRFAEMLYRRLKRREFYKALFSFLNPFKK